MSESHQITCAQPTKIKKTRKGYVKRTRVSFKRNQYEATEQYCSFLEKVSDELRQEYLRSTISDVIKARVVKFISSSETSDFLKEVLDTLNGNATKNKQKIFITESESCDLEERTRNIYFNYNRWYVICNVSCYIKVLICVKDLEDGKYVFSFISKLSLPSRYIAPPEEVIEMLNKLNEVLPKEKIIGVPKYSIQIRFGVNIRTKFVSDVNRIMKWRKELIYARYNTALDDKTMPTVFEECYESKKMNIACKMEDIWSKFVEGLTENKLHRMAEQKLGFEQDMLSRFKKKMIVFESRVIKEAELSDRREIELRNIRVKEVQKNILKEEKKKKERRNELLKKASGLNITYQESREILDTLDKL